ncbi:MAG: L,D-transpeptidase family protein [Pseudomonadota bacterium]
MRARRLSLVASLPLLALQSGCALFELPQSGDPVSAAEPPAAPPVAVEPQDKHRFELADERQSVIGEPQLVHVVGDNTLSDLARAYGLGYDEIVAANPDVDPWLPGEGTAVLLPTQYLLPPGERRGVVLNIASKRLFYFPQAAADEPAIVYTFPIGIGRVGWETPLGLTEVVAKAKDPTWYVPASVRKEHAAMGNPLPAVVPPGPDNPLGGYVLKLDMPGYLIHGTNQPYGVGMRVSHGCVRLYPENIEFLYPQIGMGERVAIVNEPYLVGERDGELFFEAHEPLEEDAVDAETRLADAIAAFAESQQVVLPARAGRHIAAVAESARGVPVKVYAYEVDDYTTRARLVLNTVVADPEAPTLEEVREMMNEVIADNDVGTETDEAATEVAGAAE